MNPSAVLTDADSRGPGPLGLPQHNHRLGGVLTSTRLILTVLGAGKCTQGAGRLTTCLPRACFLVQTRLLAVSSPRTVEGGRWQEPEGRCVFHKGTNPIQEGSTLTTHCLSEAPAPNLAVQEFGGGGGGCTDLQTASTDAEELRALGIPQSHTPYLFIHLLSYFLKDYWGGEGA